AFISIDRITVRIRYDIPFQPDLPVSRQTCQGGRRRRYRRSFGRRSDCVRRLGCSRSALPVRRDDGKRIWDTDRQDGNDKRILFPVRRLERHTRRASRYLIARNFASAVVVSRRKAYISVAIITVCLHNSKSSRDGG